MDHNANPLRPAAHPNWLEWWVCCTLMAVLVLVVTCCFAAAAILGEHAGTVTGVVSPRVGRMAGPVVLGVVYLHAAVRRHRR